MKRITKEKDVGVTDDKDVTREMGEGRRDNTMVVPR